MSRLTNGQLFPPLDVPAVGGGTISLPGDTRKELLAAMEQYAADVIPKL